MGKESATDGI